jgi:hypothetical protein
MGPDRLDYCETPAKSGYRQVRHTPILHGIDLDDPQAGVRVQILECRIFNTKFCR